ncbi:MAG: oxidoreductase [Pseudomonadota bacterium]
MPKRLVFELHSEGSTLARPIDQIRSEMLSLHGKMAIITGATSGLGYETVRSLLSFGAHAVLGVRDMEKGERIASKLRYEHPSVTVTPLHLDLASLSSIKDFAAQYESSFERLDILINNAGIGADDDTLTDDGFPRIMGVNHLGHFALTGALIAKLLDTPRARIVTMTSQVYKNSSIKLDGITKTNVNGYGASKLANLLFTLELQKRLTSVGSRTLSLAAHPGASRTEGVEQMLGNSTNPVFRLFFGFFVRNVMQSAEAGALNLLHAAADPDATGGDLYGPSGFLAIRGDPVSSRPSLDASTKKLASDLWERSANLTGVTYETLSEGTVAN